MSPPGCAKNLSKQEPQPFASHLWVGIVGAAGLWAPGKAGQPPSVAIVTTRPNDLVAPIHNRMPVILTPENEAVWLDPHQNDLVRLTAMLGPLDADRMEAYPVAPLVNAFQNEGPELIAPSATEREAVVQASLPL